MPPVTKWEDIGKIGTTKLALHKDFIDLYHDLSVSESKLFCEAPYQPEEELKCRGGEFASDKISSK